LKSNPKTKYIPILVLTGQAQEEEKLRAYDAGADDYVVKPFKRDELIIDIDRLILQASQYRRRSE